MPVFAVEIDQVDEDQSPVRHLPERVEQMVEVGVVAGAVAFVAGAAMREDIARFADRDDRPMFFRGPVEERALRRLDRVVATVVGAPERGTVGADEGTRDDAPNPQRIAKASHDEAKGVEPIEPEGVLVRRDLKHAVGRRVADRATRPEMGLAEGVDHGGDRHGSGTEDAVEPGFAHEARQKVGREAGFDGRKVTPGQ